MSDSVHLAEHQHGKARVRLGRTWHVPQPDGAVKHVFVEWTVQTALESDMAHSFLTPSNEGMTATDAQRNTVRVLKREEGWLCGRGLWLGRVVVHHNGASTTGRGGGRECSGLGSVTR